MKGDFSRSVRWPHPLDPGLLWSFVLDEEALAECSPHIRDLAVAEPERAWTARLVSHVGRFCFAAPVEVRVRDQARGQYVEIDAQGQDRRMGTRLQVGARLELITIPEPPGSAGGGVAEARLTGRYVVRGKAANLAPGIVHRHADLMVGTFWERFIQQAASEAGRDRP